MNSLQRTVADLDVHKDSVFLCILNESGKIFEAKYGVLTTELGQMRDVMVRSASAKRRKCRKNQRS